MCGVDTDSMVVLQVAHVTPGQNNQFLVRSSGLFLKKVLTRQGLPLSDAALTATSSHLSGMYSLKQVSEFAGVPQDSQQAP